MGERSAHFETQVVFENENNRKESLDHLSQKKVSTNIQKVKKPVISTKNRGLLKANILAKDNNKDTPVPPSQNLIDGSGLQNFSKNWQRKNQLATYKAVLARIVSEHWTLPPVNNRDFQILIETIIRSNGSIARTNFLSKTGMIVLDSRAMKSIQDSSPFPEFKKFILNEEKSIRVVFRFTPEKIDN
ncbi:MAG: TonB C-terminal domain-containing protein [Proteobacteria bacterium]|nr:TonB C-terminal domain-containing protein [Pseudomonadota bacterium]